jgi:SAM-dependent methyltransferase
MPDCMQCEWFKPDAGGCSSEPRKARYGAIAKQVQPRRCVNAIMARILPEIHGKVLEIGFGKSRKFRKKFRKNVQAEWYGADPRWPTSPERREFGCKASKLDWADGFFDCVYASQTMEHWAEFGDSLEDGVAEACRVLKSGGVFFSDVPMRGHGHDVFKTDDIEAVHMLFLSSAWSDVKMEPWARNCSPLTYEDATKPLYVLAIKAVRA